MFIIRKRLGEEEFNPPGTRYIVGTDTFQQYIAGEWVDMPGLDPRTNPAYLLPARTGSTRRCDAAANMTAKVESIVTFYVSSGEIALTASSVLAVILIFFPPIALIAGILWAIADLIVGLGVSTVASAFSGSVYDDLTCYFDCAADGDGQLDPTGYNQVISNIHSNHSGVVSTVLDAVFNSLGWVGLNNAGATGEETGDCGDCECEWCYPLDFRVQDYDLALSGLNGGTWVSGEGWEATNTSVSGTRTLLQGTITLPSGIAITKAAIVYDWVRSGCTSSGTSGSLWGYGTTDAYEHTTTAGNPVTTPEGTGLIQHLEVADTINKIVIDFQTSYTCYGGSTTVHHINLFGTDSASYDALVAAYGDATCE